MSAQWVGYPEDNTVYPESNFATQTLAQFRKHLEPASLRADGKYSVGDRVYPRQSYINMRILECAIERRRAQDGNRNLIIEEVNLRPDFSFSMEWRRERPIRIRIVGKFELPSLSLPEDCDVADVGHWFMEDLLEELEGEDEAAEDEATAAQDGRPTMPAERTTRRKRATATRQGGRSGNEGREESTGPSQSGVSGNEGEETMPGNEGEETTADNEDEETSHPIDYVNLASPIWKKGKLVW
ncbi:hypothetical protein AURDEDRAFT_178122, partial [Auricularia subglabra TFB-10046 SS5]